MKLADVSAIPVRSRLFSELMPYLRRKRILIGMLVAFLGLILAAAISLKLPGNNGFILYKQNIEIIPFQGALHIIIDDKPLLETVGSEKVLKHRTSIDGTVAAFLTDQKELYVVHDRHLTKIADDVHHFEISSSGDGVAFARKYAEDYSLTLYSVVKKKRFDITDRLSRLDFSLSPDGRTVVYYTSSDKQEQLACWLNGKCLTITRRNCDLVGLANDGKYIYGVSPKITGTSALFAYDTQGGATELGTVSSISFKFNADHSQIMFYNNGKTLVSVDGKKAVTVSSNPLYMVTAPNNRSTSDENSITFPVTSLFNHVYTCSDGEATSAWLIRSNPGQSEKLVSKVSGCTLDASAKYLYYIHDLEQLCVLRISNGVHAAERSVCIADKVDTFAVTSNRQKVYFTNDQQLYCTAGKNKGSPILVCDQHTGLQPLISAADVLYFQSGEDLFGCKNGRKSFLALSNTKSVFSSANSVIYITGDNGIFTAYDKKQIKQIMEAN